MTPALFWMIVVTILWLVILAFFIFTLLPAIFEIGKAIRKLKNRMARWLTGSR